MSEQTSFDFFCSSCGQKLSAPPELLGRSIECPACGVPLTVPGTADPAIAQGYPVPVTEAPPPLPPAIPAIWNPAAAAWWSLLFSAAFGAFIHARNAAALGRADEAAQNWKWFAGVLAFDAVVVLAAIFLPTDFPFGIVSLAVVAAWYSTLGKNQVAHARDSAAGNYPRKPWLAPIAAAFAAMAVVTTGAVALSGIHSLVSKPSAAKIYSKSRQEALAAAREYMVGTWTYTGTDGKFMGAWLKWEIRPDGTMLAYHGFPKDDDWRDPEAETWEIVTDKYADTGERFYAFQIKGEAARAVITEDGRVLYRIGDDPPVPMTRGDAFPFSE